MARVPLTIPKNYRKPLAKLLALDSSGLQKLVGALRTAKAAIPVGRFGARIAAELQVDPEDARELFQLLGSLYILRTRRGLSIEDLVDGLRDAAVAEGQRQEPLSTEPQNWEPLKRHLTDLLSLDQSLGISAKGYDIWQEQACLFCAARMLTDLRPIFGGDVKESPTAGVILHTLHLSYHEGETTEELFLALAPADIRELQRILERALQKEKTLRTTAARCGMECVESDAHSRFPEET